MTNVRLIIVDDDPTIRFILRSLVEELGAEVVAEADNGRSAIERAQRNPADIILLDVSMPVMEGFPAARRLRMQQPHLRIIFISQHNERTYAEEALGLGAKGYLVKGSVGTELAPAIEKVMEGDTFVSQHVISVGAHT